MKLTEDFIKVSGQTQNNKTFEEFHMYPVLNISDTIRTMEEQDASRLNIIFIMVDSMSHSCGERYLKRTVKRLRQSPSSIILNVSFFER